MLQELNIKYKAIALKENEINLSTCRVEEQFGARAACTHSVAKCPYAGNYTVRYSMNYDHFAVLYNKLTDIGKEYAINTTLV